MFLFQDLNLPLLYVRTKKLFFKQIKVYYALQKTFENNIFKAIQAVFNQF